MSRYKALALDIDGTLLNTKISNPATAPTTYIGTSIAYPLVDNQ